MVTGEVNGEERRSGIDYQALRINMFAPPAVSTSNIIELIGFLSLSILLRQCRRDIGFGLP